MNLALLADCNAVEIQLDEVQVLINEARANFPLDGELQYQCDLQQAVLDDKRRTITNVKNHILSPN